MKIIATLDDICRPEHWLVTHHAHMVVQTYPPQLAEAEIKGKDLLALAANQHEMPGVINIRDAEYLGLPHKVYMGFALLEDIAEEAWLGLADKIRKALKEVEVENLYLTMEDEGLSAYYLLEFDTRSYEI